MVLAWRAMFLWSCISGSIHPSSRCIHHSPSSSSAPKSCASCPCIVLLAYLNEMHQCRCLNAWKCSRRYNKKNKQGRHNVTIAWARAWWNGMQCDQKKNMTGQSFIEWTQQTSSQDKKVGAAVRELRFNLFSMKCFLQKALLNLF